MIFEKISRYEVDVAKQAHDDGDFRADKMRNYEMGVDYKHFLHQIIVL